MWSNALLSYTLRVGWNLETIHAGWLAFGLCCEECLMEISCLPTRLWLIWPSTKEVFPGTNFLHFRATSALGFRLSLRCPAGVADTACRVTLQSSLGMSMDLFHVRVVSQSASEEESFWMDLLWFFFRIKHILKNKIGESTGIMHDYALFPMAFLGKCKFWMDCSHTLRSGWPGKPVKVSFICWLSSWMPIRSLFQMPERRGLHWTIRSETGTPVLVLHPHHLAVKRNLHCPTIIWDWPVISSVCVLSDFLWISTIVATCSGWCFKTS